MFNILKKITEVEKRVGKYLGRVLLMDLLLNSTWRDSIYKPSQRRPEFLEWLSSDLVDITEEFVQANRLCELSFIKNMNRTFKTSRFELLLKRVVVQYLAELFGSLDYFSGHKSLSNERLALEDNPLNRFGVKKYHFKFGSSPEIRWKRQFNLFQRILRVFLHCLIIFYLSLKMGLRISGKRKRYKVMREAIWGLYNTDGFYFHDDFLVDGDKVKKEDLLLFSRGIAIESGRLKAYHDARSSPYAHFNLDLLPLGIIPFFHRIIPKYVFSGSRTLLNNIDSVHYSLFSSVFFYFVVRALPYERIFSNFKITSELGHALFSPSHIVESIVCAAHGTKYYLMHWSDLSIQSDKFAISYLGCDNYFLWGKAHITGVEGNSDILRPTGYVFKRFIKEVKSNRNEILSKMRINAKGKIISFFDESFGRETKMTEKNFLDFWRTALDFALKNRNHTVIMKQKALSRYKNLSKSLKKQFEEIKFQMEELPNVWILVSDKSFIEVIGVSDVVITQGMTSSATIAIICGIEGLYLDQAKYNHPFKKLFKDKIVFDDPDKLLLMLDRIIEGTENPLKDIPENILRDYDAYEDDRGIDRFRQILTTK